MDALYLLELLVGLLDRLLAIMFLKALDEGHVVLDDLVLFWFQHVVIVSLHNSAIQYFRRKEPIAIFYKSETFTKFQNFILNSKDSKKIGGTQALAAE